MPTKIFGPNVKEEHRLRLFNNRVPTKIFGPNVKAVTEDQRTMHNEELQNLYPHQLINGLIESRSMRWVRNMACIVQKRMHGFCEDT